MNGNATKFICILYLPLRTIEKNINCYLTFPQHNELTKITMLGLSSKHISNWVLFLTFLEILLPNQTYKQKFSLILQQAFISNESTAAIKIMRVQSACQQLLSIQDSFNNLIESVCICPTKQYLYFLLGKLRSIECFILKKTWGSRHTNKVKKNLVQLS